MSCSPFDLRDYFLKELSDPERRQVELHVRSCPPCREELDRLQVTETALFALREEEIPQRIAFVSDKIFEPSPWRRALAGFWNSSARLAFASAAMLSIAVVVYSFSRPAPAPVVATTTPAPAAVSPATVQQQIEAAVTQAVAQSEARQARKLDEQISQMKQLVAWAETDREISLRRQANLQRATYFSAQAENGERK